MSEPVLLSTFDRRKNVRSTCQTTCERDRLLGGRCQPDVLAAAEHVLGGSEVSDYQRPVGETDARVAVQHVAKQAVDGSESCVVANCGETVLGVKIASRGRGWRDPSTAHATLPKA